MADFDPNAYLGLSGGDSSSSSDATPAADVKPAFDPNAYLGLDQPPPAQGSYPKEFGKGLVRGAADAGLSMARGVGTVINQASQAMYGSQNPDLNKPLDNAQQAVDQKMAPAPGWENSYTGKAGEVLGGIAPYAAATVVGGLPLAAGAGALSGADQGEQVAKAAGATPGATGAAVLGDAAVGLVMGSIPGVGELAAKLGPAGAKAVTGYALRTAAAAGTGFTLGAVTDAMNQAVQKYAVDPEHVMDVGQSLSNGAWQAAAMGLLHQGHELFRKPPAPEAKPAEPEQPQVAGLLGYSIPLPDRSDVEINPKPVGPFVEGLLPPPATRLPDQSGADINAPAPEPQRALPPPGSVPPSTGDGRATLDADPQGTPIQRARYGVQQLDPGSPITNSVLANIAGIPKNDVEQIKAIRQELIARNWVDQIGTSRWVRAADAPEAPERTPAGTPVPERPAPGNDPANPRPDMTNIGDQAKTVADDIAAGKTPDEAVGDAEAQKPTPEAQPGAPGAPPEAVKPPEAPVAPPAPEAPVAQPAAPPVAPPPAAPPADDAHLQHVRPLINALKSDRDWAPNPQNVAKRIGTDTEMARRVLDAAVAQRDSGLKKYIKQGAVVYARAPIDKGPVDLVTYLTRNGGIKSGQGGETKDWQRPIPGSGSFITKEGMTLDKATQLAIEAGYLPPNPPNAPPTVGINNLIEAVNRNHAAGKDRSQKVYSMHDIERVQDEEHARQADVNRGQMENEASALGIADPHKLKDDELAQAIYDARSKAGHEAEHEDEEHGDAWLPDEEQGGAQAEPQGYAHGEDPFADHAPGSPGVDHAPPDDFDPPFEHAPALGQGADREADRAASAHPESLDDRLEEHRPSIDQTDQGAQRVIPGAERRTEAEAAAAAKAKRDADLLALKQQQSKLRSSKRQEEPGGLFGDPLPKQGTLFEGKGDVVEAHPQDAGDRSGQLAKHLAEEGIGAGTPGRLMRAIGRWLSDQGPIEHGVSVDQKTGKVIQTRTDGQPASVSLGGAAIAAASDPNNRIVFLHNHPRNTALSFSDIGQLARLGLRWIVANGQDGAFSAAKLSDKLRAIMPNGSGFLHTLAHSVAGTVERALVKEIERKTISPEEATAYHSDIINHVLANHGFIDYVSNLNSASLPRAAVARVMAAGAKPARAAYVFAFKEPLPNDPTGLRNRPAASVRAEVGADRVFGVDEAPTAKPAGQPDGAAGDGQSAAGPRGEAVAPKANPPRLLPGQLQGRLFEGLTGDKLENAVMQESARATKEREDQYPAFLRNSINRYVGAPDTRSLYDKIKDSIIQVNRGTFNRIYQGVIDRRFNPNEKNAIPELVRSGEVDARMVDPDGTLGAGASAHYAATMADKTSAFVKSMLTNGAFAFRDKMAFDTVNVGADGKPLQSFLDIMKPIVHHPDGDQSRLFITAVRITRDKRLAAEGRSKTYTPEAQQALTHIMTAHPEFAPVMHELQRFNETNLRALVDSGRIDEATYKKWTKDGDYSPFYRQIGDELTRTSGVKGPRHLDQLTNDSSFKALKGGDSQIADFWANSVRNMQAVAHSAMANVAANRYLRDAKAVGLARRVQGNPIELETRPNVVRSYENGKAVYHEVDDAATMNALRGMDGAPINGFLKLLGKPANLLRMGTTHMPTFLLWTHPMRESFVSWMTTKSNVLPIVSAVKGNYNVIRGTDLAKELGRHGVVGGYDLKAGNGDAIGRVVSAIYDKDAKGTMAGIRKVWHAREKIVDSADAGVRTQVYQAELKRYAELGMPAPDAQAAYKALRNSVNFGQRGAYDWVHWAAIAIPFLNARIQGLDTLGRAAVRNPANFAGKALTLAGLAAAYSAMVSGNPLYERATDEMKDNNFLIPVGDKLIPVARPFEAGVLFVRPIERAYRLMMGTDNTHQTWQAVQRAVFDTLKFNPVPQAGLPALEVATNHSFFTGQPVVPDSLSRLPPAMQQNARTSEIAKGVGAVTGVSPMNIDHLVQGYFGTVATYAQFLTDSLIRAAEGGPARPSTGVTGWPIASSIIKDARNMGSAQVNQFYELKKEVDQQVAAMSARRNAGAPQDAASIRQDNARLLSVKTQVEAIGRQLSGITKEQNRVLNNTTMDPDAKRAEMDRLDRLRQSKVANVQDLWRRAHQ